MDVFGEKTAVLLSPIRATTTRFELSERKSCSGNEGQLENRKRKLSNALPL